MALTKVINDLADLNQSGSTNALKGCVGTTAQQPASSSSIDYLIVGGGGGAGGGIANSWGGGGGGAGGYLTGSTTVYHGIPTVITVGEGGDGNNVRTAAGFNGDDSGFNGIRAIGGGGGGAESIDAVDGASGGGAGGNLSGTASQPGSSVSGQGNAGGGVASPVNGAASGGGGGGAVGSIPSTSSFGGAGGIGVDQTSFISVVNANLAQIGDTSNATQVMISGGGGGASDYQTGGNGGTGGLGGGGNGGNDGTNSGNGIAGTSNTGGGGGGGNADPSTQALGGTGGSGVSVLKYDNTIVTGYTLNSEDTYTVNWPADKFGAAYWPLNLDVKDVGGNYDGTATDITYTNGQFNQAASFNGSSSIIQATQPAQSESFTISAWVKTTASGAWNIAVAMGATPSVVYGLTMWISGTSNSLYAQWGNGSTEDYWPNLPTTPINTGEWFHIAITVNDINAPTVKGYINGVLEGSGYTSGAAITYNPNLFTIGGRENTSGTLSSYWNGEIEQVRFYGSELSITDVQDIYNNSKPGSLPPLKTSSDLTTDVCNFPTGVTGGGFYDFIGTANDTCGNNNGTFTNSSYSSTIAKFGQSAGPFVYNSSPGSETRIYTGAGNEVTTTEGNKTLSAWVYPTGANTQGGFIVFANGKLVISYYSSMFYAYKYINGTDIFDTSCSGGQTKSITSFANYPIDNWYHVAVVMSGTGDYDFKLYVNGIYINGTQGSTAFCGYDNSVNGGFIIGGSYNYQGTHYYNGFDGYIDRVRVYASALTDQNIYDLWQKENDIQTYFPDAPTSGTDTLVFKEGSGEITFKNDSPPGAEVGMLRYNSTLNKMEHFNSGGWKDFSYCTTDLCDYPTQADNVLLYRFNDDVTDTCGTYNGTAGGSLSYTAGKFGNAINTTSGYVDTGYIFPADSTMSVSFWMNLTTAPGATDVYMLSDMDSGAGNLRLALRIAGAYSNKLYIDISDGSSSDAKDTGWIPAYNTWYHIAITFNGTAVVLYVDGVSTLSYTSTVAFGTAGAQQQVIGRPGAYTSCCYFPGLIDQFRLFTSTLTANEVLDLYNEVQC